MALTNKLDAIGAAIREKTGDTNKYTLDEMVTAIGTISGGGGGADAKYTFGDNWEFGGNVETLITSLFNGGSSSPFYNLGSLITSVNLPVCTEVQNSALINLTKLTSATLPVCTTFGGYAFYGCTNLTSIDLPQATTFGGNAFQGCTNLTSIDLPQATTFGNSAFQGCTKLTSLILHQPIKWGSASNAFSDTTDALTIRSTAESVGSNWRYLANILGTLIFDNATTVPTDAFNGMNIKALDLPKATEVQNSALINLTKLTSATLPVCTTFSTYAFRGCTSLTTVDLPQATTFGDSAFSSCTSLASIDLPQATTFSSNAFQGCTKLTTITLPKATSINGSYFCYNCQALTALVITNTEKVCSLTSTSNAFVDSPIKSGTGYIYVPDALVDSYKTATNWSVFADQIKPLSELPTE